MLHALLQTVGQTYTYTTTTTSSSSSGPGAAFWVAYFVVVAALVVLMVASMWRIFTKAGKPGWAAIIPIYNTIVLLQIVKRPLWWFFLFLIPIVNFFVGIVVYYDLVKSFGRGVGTLLLLLLVPFIGYPMLAFGSAKYKAPMDKAAAK